MLNMKRVLVWFLAGGLWIGLAWAKKYEARQIQIHPAAEYPAHQDFQDLVIGAQTYNTEEAIQQVFDTKNLFRHSIMPVLVVINNRNNFAIRIHNDDVFLIDSMEVHHQAMRLEDVLLSVALNRPISSVPTGKGLQLGRIDRNLQIDFEQKFFGEKLIAPGGSDWGIVFFPLLQGEALEGTRLYLPEIRNITDGEPLIFFEFELNAAAP